MDGGCVSRAKAAIAKVKLIGVAPRLRTKKRNEVGASFGHLGFTVWHE